MLSRRGLTFKLSISVLLGSVAVFVTIFAYNYRVSRRILVAKIADSAGHLTQETAQRIEAVLRPIEKVPADLACMMEHAAPQESQMLATLQAAVAGNREVFGSTIAFEPFFAPGKGRYYAPYYYRDKDAVALKYLGNDNYQYHSWEWYAVPKQSGRPVWTEPYYDEGGGQVVMSTYSVPFYQMRDGKHTLSGVVTADVSLTWLHQLVGSMKIGRTGYGFIVSRKGVVVAHPRQDLILNATLAALPENNKDAAWDGVIRQMSAGQTGFAPVTNHATGKTCWIAYVPLESTGWSLGVIFPQDELMADVTTLNRVVLTIGIAGFLMLAVVIAVVSRGITRPLRQLADATHDIARGNLDFDPPTTHSQDEIGRLAESFRIMQGSLKQYIQELTSTAAAKQKIESELSIAHDIQMSILPKIFPPFPNRPEFDIYAVIEPAKEVGGDLFDFFFTDETHLCFVIGDVSGKGVPASLLMAVTKTLIKTTAQQTHDPAEILARVNREVARDNDACMFVTVFCGLLDTTTGNIEYANAGHNPPLLCRTSGRVEPIQAVRSMAVGVMPDSTYTRGTFVMAPGDTLVMYTDGVTEAANAQESLFGDHRLLTCARQYKPQPAREFLETIIGQVREFIHGAPPSDDITLMTLHFQGAANESVQSSDALDGITCLALKNELSEIARLSAWIEQQAAEHQFSEKLAYDLNIVLEELVTNVVVHGYTDGDEHIIDVRMKCDDDRLELELEDDGMPFDPLKATEPDVNLPMDQRPVGGLGIHFVRKAMDSLSYRRVNDHNCLTLTKHLREPSGADNASHN